MSTVKSDEPQDTHAASAQTLGFLLHDTARLIRRRFLQKAREAGLPLNESEALVLQSVRRNEGINQIGLAQQLDTEPITLVRLLDRLQAAGLVERRPHKTDRRVWTIWLTTAAGPILDRIDTVRLTVRAEAVSGLTLERQDALLGTLSEIRENLLRESVEKAAGGDRRTRTG